MQLTRAADYAVRVMVHLAGLPPGARATAAEMAAAGDVPEAFLSKILQSLGRSGLIASHRGIGGGYKLARAPETVTLMDMVESIEGPIRLNACVVEGGCARVDWCSVHEVWMRAQEAVTTVLRGETLASLAAKAGDPLRSCGEA